MTNIGNIAFARTLNHEFVDNGKEVESTLAKHTEFATEVLPAGTSKKSNLLQSWNHLIRHSEQNGELVGDHLEALRNKRSELIKDFTGNTSAASYDVDVVAWAESNGTTYNHEAQQLNNDRKIQNIFRSADNQIPYVNEVRELPWEASHVNERIDNLITSEGLSADAATVVAMTERTAFSSGSFSVHTLVGSWQPNFAARVQRAGPELEAWATAEMSDAKNTSIALSANNDDVTILQNEAGQIVVRDNTGKEADRLVDSAGTDRIVILGGDGNDKITIDSSVTENMLVAGGAGDDHLFGGKGNDILIGGDGIDLIRGNEGTDIIIGGHGDDNIEGGRGADIVRGGNGDDYVSGGRGNDIIQGGAGRDSLYGGFGEDLISGNAGNDYIDGGGHRDLLNGGMGADTVSGGKGDDRINGGSGSDTLIGASGNDVYDDSTVGDHVIHESAESKGGLSATSTVVDIDPIIDQVGDFVSRFERSEFQLRVSDDLETLRSLQAGQEFFADLKKLEAHTGNSVKITELDATSASSQLLNGTIRSSENGQLAAGGVDSTIFYDPSSHSTSSVAHNQQHKPPVIVLFHSLLNAADSIR